MTCGDKRGTLTGWNRHMKAWEDACPECRAASNDYQRQRRATNPDAAQQARDASRRRATAIKRLIARHRSEYLDLLREAT